MNKSKIPALVGLINLLLKANENITIYINEKAIPASLGCWLLYDTEDCDINSNMIIFDLKDRIRDMFYIGIDCIKTISIEYERSL